MRYASLFAVLGLVFVLAASSFSPVAAGLVTIEKVTTNGDTTTEFTFTVVVDGSTAHYDLTAGPNEFSFNVGGDLTFTEEALEGWVLESVKCVGTTSTFTYITGGVTIHYEVGDSVTCTFTNSLVEEAVGGLVMPANTFALVAPWLAVIGLVGCISTVVVVAKKHKK